MIVRPIESADLDALVQLVAEASVGMTTLPAKRERLAAKIEDSRQAFSLPSEGGPAEELFFFVLEDPASSAIVGTCGILSGIGLEEPFYSYRVGINVHASRELGVHKAIPTLYLANDYTGCAELCSLFLHPGYRGGGNGRLLSKSRFLFLAEFAHRFPDKLIAELRGVSDAEGRSPFWEGLGRHFFSMDFSQADALCGERSKTFIAELMPRIPIYVPLLPESAQRVIGEVHEETRAALRLLEGEGFHTADYVDIFDAGPTVEACLPDIRSIRESRRLAAEIGALPEESRPMLISNTRWEQFRCTFGQAQVTTEGTVRLSPEVAQGLLLAHGDPVRVVSL